MTGPMTAATRPIDDAIADAIADGLPIDRITRRKDGRASSLYLAGPDGLIRISDHVLPPWLPGPVKHADIMVSRKRNPRRETVRRAMRLLTVCGDRPDWVRALAQDAPVVRDRPRRPLQLTLLPV